MAIYDQLVRKTAIAWITQDEFGENREGHGFQPCRMARSKVGLQPLREGAGVIQFDSQPCRR